MTDSKVTKICRDCHRDLPLDQFHKHSNTADRLRPECRQCVKEYRRAYYLSRQSELKDYSATYYQNNREQTLKTVKKYSGLNKSRIASRYKKWRKANTETIKAKQLVYVSLNREKIAKTRRQYHKKHPEYAKASTQRRRARLRSMRGTFNARLWLAKCEYFGWRCYICGTSVTRQTAQPDHRKPISRGGLNWISNIAPACPSCNLSKSKKTEAEYRDHICFQKLNTESVAALDVIA